MDLPPALADRLPASLPSSDGILQPADSSRAPVPPGERGRDSRHTGVDRSMTSMRRRRVATDATRAAARRARMLSPDQARSLRPNRSRSCSSDPSLRRLVRLLAQRPRHYRLCVFCSGARHEFTGRSDHAARPECARTFVRGHVGRPFRIATAGPGSRMSSILRDRRVTDDDRCGWPGGYRATATCSLRSGCSRARQPGRRGRCRPFEPSRLLVH